MTVQYVQPDLETSLKSWRTVLDDSGIAELCTVEPPNFDYRQLDFSQGTVNLFGKTYPEPRLTAYYGNHPGTYFYSGKANVPLAFPPILLQLKHQVETITGFRFNSALCNYYRDGNDSMGWHSDNEFHYHPGDPIASLSIGASRDFVFRKKSDRRVKVLLPLHHGDLLVMKGPLQQFWEHSLPVRKRVKDYRINITFRRYRFQVA